MKRTLMILLLVIAAALEATQPTSPPEGSESGLELTLEALPRSNTFFLRAMNQGASSVLLIRPRAGMVDHFENWGGWSVEVRGPGGPLFPMAFPGGLPPFTSLDLIELRPGESVGVVFNLDHYVNSQQVALADAPGAHTLVARYHLIQDKVHRVPAEPGDAFLKVPRLPPAQSKALAYVVQTRPIPSKPARH